jgi:MYXO-CTERM domain-containing protein
MRYVHSSVATIVLGLAWAAPAAAVTSSRSVPSAFDGNGHNISFDGRLLLVRDAQGWQARLLRPEGATFHDDGLPDAAGPLVSPRVLIFGDPEIHENALAICESNPARAPYACDAAGNDNAAGPYDCYDLWILDSDAVTPPAQGGFVLRRRHLLLWVSNPKTADAAIHDWQWGAIEPLSPTLKGIEPTVTRDGKLMVYQGHPANNGDIDILMYTMASSACAASGWSAPAPISSMHDDSKVVGRYPLAERPLRSADGDTFAKGALFRGAYPWITADGEAVIFAATPMPCVSENNPPGCGPRRNSLSVIGYPTNWGIAHIDGGANPDTNSTVRLFFSSPGPATFSNIPVSPGADVWPFFGTNTSNYVELTFDDGLDGNYAAFWHLNENVTSAGELDTGRAPDVSGYFNTASLEGGLSFATANDGVVGKSLSFDGVDDHLLSPNTQSLNPVNGITLDFWIQPAASPDCDGNNNWRLLIGKGSAFGPYSVVLEENLAVQTRVRVDGVEQAMASPPLAVGTWTHVSFEYDGPSGKSGIWFDDVEVASTTHASGTIDGDGEPVLVGGPGPRAACPNGDGSFAGRLDEVSISRYARRLGEPPAGEGGAGGAGAGGSSASGATSGNGGSGANAGGPGDDGAKGCACRSAGVAALGGEGAVALALLTLLAGARRRRARHHPVEV